MIRRSTILIVALSMIAMLAWVALGAGNTNDDVTPRVDQSSKPTDLQPRYTAEEQVLLAIQEEGQIRLRAIADRLEAETDPDRRRELRDEGIALKKQTRIRFLETLAGFARQRGDQVTEQQALDQIEYIKNPSRAVGKPIRQTPGKDEIQRGEK